MNKTKLWTRNFSLLICATALGAVGGITGSYALSFLVYDETGSTFAAGLLIALRIIPQFFLPIIIAPWMDRLPRKPFLVFGDLLGGILYASAGIYLRSFEFSYTGYLLFSLILACIGSFDTLAYNSIFPKIIPEGCEEKGYTISGMLYPVMNVIMMPVAAFLMDWIGVANILLLQGILSLLAALSENQIILKETSRLNETKQGIALWWHDLCDGIRYLKEEKGLLNLYAYMAATNGAATGYSSILIAFFRSTPGFNATMYAFFSIAEFAGRSLGGALHYNIKIPSKKRFSFTFLVYQIYESMDMILLWLPYPLMLVNRAVCGFLGINSAVLRQTATQKYIPEEYRARVNAFGDVLICAASGGLALIVGAVGEIFSYRITMTLTAAATIIICWATVYRNRCSVTRVFEAE